MAALFALPFSASWTLADDFVEILEERCLSALRTGAPADTSGLVPAQPDPDLLTMSVGLETIHLTEDGTVALLQGEVNGSPACEVAVTMAAVYAGSADSVSGTAVALRAWATAAVATDDWALNTNCPAENMHFFWKIVSTGPDEDGRYIELVMGSVMLIGDGDLYGPSWALAVAVPGAPEPGCLSEGAE